MNQRAIEILQHAHRHVVEDSSRPLLNRVLVSNVIIDALYRVLKHGTEPTKLPREICFSMPLVAEPSRTRETSASGIPESESRDPLPHK